MGRSEQGVQMFRGVGEEKVERGERQWKPEAGHLDASKDSVECDDSGGVGAEARQHGGAEEDGKEEPKLTQHLRLHQACTHQCSYLWCATGGRGT